MRHTIYPSYTPPNPPQEDFNEGAPFGGEPNGGGEKQGKDEVFFIVLKQYYSRSR